MCLPNAWSRWEVHLLISPSCRLGLTLLKGERGPWRNWEGISRAPQRQSQMRGAISFLLQWRRRPFPKWSGLGGLG